MSESESGEPVSLELTISNQSLEVSPVVVKVWLDGKLVAQQAAESGEGVEAGHQWYRRKLEVAPGTHTLVATSKPGEASLEQEIELSEGSYNASLMFWYSRTDSDRGAYFTLAIDRGPVARM
jgi:hypothetical protein